MARNEELARLIQGEQTDAVSAMEDGVAERAVGSLEEECAALAASTLAAWTSAFGAPGAEAGAESLLKRIISTIREAIRRILSGTGDRARRALDAALAPAVALGVRQGSEVLTRLTGRKPHRVGATPSRALRRAPSALPDVVDEQRRSALALLKSTLVRRTGVTGLLAAVGRARATAGRVSAHIAWTINQAVNEGLAAGIRAIGADKLWVSERDACVSCAAYAGLLAPVGETFPGGLSWDPAQRGKDRPLDGPPLHPHCRCRVIAWKNEWAEPGMLPFPEALHREARRSIARGWSLPTESNAARVRAARELLRRGSGLPRSVDQFAAAAVRAGRFADRTFPASEQVAG